MTQRKVIDIGGKDFVEITDDVRHRLNPEQPRMCAAAVIVWNEDREQMLMSYHIKRDGWELVAGAVKAGETPLYTVKRELREEIGVRAENFELIGVNEGLPDWFTLIYQCDCVEAPSPLEPKEPEVHREFGWFDHWPKKLTKVMQICLDHFIHTTQIPDGPLAPAGLRNVFDED